ncbi:MBL fold metallo-hydrolase [Isoptericola chiayiensis]|uniref:MBL fold metallo-hydrolase n=1 Tax=Isoptericola chiayiensis TaxID=579446 RepID=A0ABP8YBL2_9MICO|nr:MBL fold metallo-hydrolase [Isoptericola chiayiensis]NOV99796.1 glyoxylase-like metal-dependent hydrolase (beta-lactamase superfamily II) [Isoptericola chiayiensis]
MGFEVVADGVLVRTSRRLCTTTSLLLGGSGPHGRGAVLVDPAWEPDELAAVAAEAREREVGVLAGFATHAHHDHLLWPPGLAGPVPRWATATTARIARRERARLLAEAGQDAARYGGRPPTPEMLDLLGRVDALPAGATAVPDPLGLLPRVEVVEHDAHAPGHAALWLPGPHVLLAGDMLSDVEPPLVLDEITGTGGLGGYRAGLETLAPYAARASVVVPGHGTPTARGAERLDADRRYLDAVAAGREPDDVRLGTPDGRAAYEELCSALRGG